MVFTRLKIKNNIMYMVLPMMVASAIVLHGVQTFLSSVLSFVSGNTDDFKRKAACLDILAHLFETCEVFER